MTNPGFNILSDGKFQCVHCNTVCQNLSIMKTHLNKHSTKYRCEPCNHNFTAMYHLKKHQDSVHNAEKEDFKCPKCQQVFQEQDQLKMHFVEMSCQKSSDSNVSGVKPEPSLFDRIQQFKQGSEIGSNQDATNIKPPFLLLTQKAPVTVENPEMRCDFCPMKLSGRYAYARHMVGHSGPLKCSKCNKGYSDSPGGRIYMEKHVKDCKGIEKWTSSNGVKLEPVQISSVVPVQQQETLPPLMNVQSPNVTPETSSGKMLTGNFKSMPILVKEDNGNQQAQSPSFVIKKGTISSNSMPILVGQENFEPEQLPVDVANVQAPPNPVIIKSEPKNNKYFEQRNANFLQFLNNRNNPVAAPAPSPAHQQQAPTLSTVKEENVKEKKKLKPVTSKRKQSSDTSVSKSPKKKPVERTQFGPKGKCYERYWCIGCDNWINGGKQSATNHLRSRHEYDECQIIMITNQGMLKVDKEDFAPDKNAKKPASNEHNDSGIEMDTFLNNSSLNESLGANASFDFNLTLNQDELKSVDRQPYVPQFQYQTVVSNVVGNNKSELVYSGDDIQQSPCVKDACSDLFSNASFEKHPVELMKNVRNKRKIIKYEHVFHIQNIKSLKFKQPYHETQTGGNKV